MEDEMYWHLSIVGSSQSDGLVPDCDVESGAAKLGWTTTDDGVRVYVGWVDPACDDPLACLQAAAGGQYQVHYRDSSGRTRPGFTGTQEECERRARSYVGPEGVRTEETDRVSFRGPWIDRGPNLSLAPGLVAWVAPVTDEAGG